MSSTSPLYSRADRFLCTLGAIALLVNVAGAQQRPPTLDPTYGRPIEPSAAIEVHRELDAKWIWAADTKDNQTVYFRRVLDMVKDPGAARLYITADNSYDLQIDGYKIGASEPDKDKNDEGWRQVHNYDLTSFLSAGTHLITVQATNTGGSAGLLARLQVDGQVNLLTGRGWTVCETKPGDDWTTNPSATGDWKPVTLEAPVGEGPWGTNLRGWPGPLEDVPAYLHHMPIDPVKLVYPGPKEDFDKAQWVNTGAKIHVVLPATDLTRQVTIDFGKELSGRVKVESKTPIDLTVGTGESSWESFYKPYTSTALNIGAERPSYSTYTAFRYATITLPPRQNEADIVVQADHLFYPVEYRGAFDCSDPLLTRIWYTGAYTAHLCMQQDIWDAPKRDRARWMGDLHVSGEVINNVFLDKFLMEQTMRRLREDAQGGNAPIQMPKGNVNDIPGYSCAWICGLADFYRHTGDSAYVKSQHPLIVGMLDFLITELDANGLFANVHKQWPFVDWAPDFDKDTPLARATTHLFIAKAMREGVWLLRDLGDVQNSRRFETQANSLVAVALKSFPNAQGAFGDRRQENSMAVYSGVAPPSNWPTIFDKTLSQASGSWAQQATPYYDNYFIFALSQMGHTPEAMKFVRWYWGGMMAEGATSMWEGYDPTWDKADFHLHLNADDGTGYFVSLAHGWSAGVTNWLTERVLGVRSTGAGFATCEIQPDLADLAWASGTIPTPHGAIKVRAEQQGPAVQVTIIIPRGVQAHVILPGTHIIVNGHRTANGLLQKPGKYIVRTE